jgi:molybdate/tungstate transport system ATP-binding protein
MIEVKVKKKLGTFQLDSELNDEGIICLTGRNGAGKSSLLNVIFGLLTPDEGYVKLNSRDITNLPIEKREIVLATPESYIPHLEVEKHLIWGAKMKGMISGDGFVSEVGRSLGISSLSGKVGKLSLGMRERVALATAIVARPQAILVDETFSNIDNRGHFINSFGELAKRSNTDVIFTTQNLEDSELAEHHYRMERGRVERVF